MIRKASCCCQKCSIEIDGEPVMNAICHCNSCKRRTGSAFGWSAYFTGRPGAAKDWRPQSLCDIRDAGSGRSDRSAPIADSTLFWKADIMPGYTGGRGRVLYRDSASAAN